MIYDLLHSTGQDFTAAQRERAQEDFKVLFKGAPPHPPFHSHTKDSHSTGITLPTYLVENSKPITVLLRLHVSKAHGKRQMLAFAMLLDIISFLSVLKKKTSKYCASK